MQSEICWTALYVRSRHEKKVNTYLKEKGIEAYLPLRKILRQWSDRKKWVEEPLFRCYVFIHTDAKDRYYALQTPGVVGLVKFQGVPAKLRDEEIERIKKILKEFPSVEACPEVTVGDRVEIVRGPMIGLRGRLEQIRGEHRLVVMIDSIHQAMRFSVDRNDVNVIKKMREKGKQERVKKYF